MYDKIKMKKVHIEYFNKIYNILLECSAWLKSKGIKQWNPPYPENRFKDDIKNGKVYYFIREKRIRGTATISAKKPFYYPSNLWKFDIKTWYITKLAVPRKLKGRNIGKKLLIKIEKEAKLQKIKKLRLDVPEYNKKLIDYYFDSGFAPVKKAILKTTPSILMEKKIK